MTRTWWLRILARNACGLALALAAAQTARADVFTVDQNYSFTLGNGALIDIAPASVVFNTTDFLLEDPPAGVDPPTDEIFVAAVTLRVGSAPVDEVQVAVGTTAAEAGPKAAASLDDAGVAPSFVAADGVRLTGFFAFSPELVAGESSVRLLVAYNFPGEMQVGDTVNFLVSTGVGDETVQATIDTGTP